MDDAPPPVDDGAPLYSWQPDSASTAPWLPAPVPERSTRAQLHSPTAPGRTRRNVQGIGGTILAALLAVLKYGAFLVKAGKFLPTLISMLVAVWFYTLFFGPSFAVGIVVLILVHELGHVVVARQQGLPSRLPIFLGPIGAVTNIGGRPRDAGQGAIIALAGPAFGTVGALACFLFAGSTSTGNLYYLMLALAYFGCFLNLFNLTPLGFLDGAKVADAVPMWSNVLGLLVLGGVALFLGNTIALIVLILGVFHTAGRIRRARDATQAPLEAAAQRRVGLGIAYLVVILVAAAGMSLAHSAIVSSNYIPGVTQSSGSA